MSYLAIKHFHIACVAISGSFFALRGYWMWTRPALLQRRWVKVAPHVIDTLLLGSALTMVALSGLVPFVQSWLTAKVLALVAYIVLGSLALKRGKTRQVRLMAFFSALAVFCYIVLVALTRRAAIFG